VDTERLRVAATGLRTPSSLVSETQSGWVWLLKMGLLFVIAGMVARDMQSRGSGMTFFVSGLALSALLLAASALSGHASTAEGSTFALQVLADMLHLLACGLWLGGIWPLTALLSACRRKGDAAACIVATAVTQRFSPLALACVAVLIVTGTYNAWNMVGGFAPLFGTTYGKLLLLKLGLLLLLLALGAMNLIGLKPKIAEAAGARPEDTVVHLGRLARNVNIEIALGL